MLTARDAALTLLALKGELARPIGMDDQTESGLAYRWWITEDERLRGSWWRGAECDFGPVAEIIEERAR